MINMIFSKELKQQKIEEETQDIEFIRVSNKPDGGNYASWTGVMCEMKITKLMEPQYL